MTDFECDVLKYLDGQAVPGLAWGAAMSEAVERLRGQGYVRREWDRHVINYKITEKGRRAIR